MPLSLGLLSAPTDMLRFSRDRVASEIINTKTLRTKTCFQVGHGLIYIFPDENANISNRTGEVAGERNRHPKVLRASCAEKR